MSPIYRTALPRKVKALPTKSRTYVWNVIMTGFDDRDKWNVKVRAATQQEAASLAMGQARYAALIHSGPFRARESKPKKQSRGKK